MIAVKLFAYLAGWFLAQGIRVADWLLQDTGAGRGETAAPPDFDEHADMAIRQVLAGSDLDYARVPALPDVPFGTGESLARELTDYLLRETP